MGLGGGLFTSRGREGGRGYGIEAAVEGGRWGCRGQSSSRAEPERGR